MVMKKMVSALKVIQSPEKHLPQSKEISVCPLTLLQEVSHYIQGKNPEFFLE